MAINLNTGRGVYHLEMAAACDTVGTDLILPLALVRADGIERVTFRCRVEGALTDNARSASIDNLIERLAPSIEREFEIIREAALKSIRGERKLLEITFSAD
jgi:hypothetical protein